MINESKYTQYGTTGGDNGYPLLQDTLNDWFVAIPIGECNDVIKHFNEIDAKLTEIEGKLSATDEDKHKPYPDDYKLPAVSGRMFLTKQQKFYRQQREIEGKLSGTDKDKFDIIIIGGA